MKDKANTKQTAGLDVIPDELFIFVAVEPKYLFFDV